MLGNIPSDAKQLENKVKALEKKAGDNGSFPLSEAHNAPMTPTDFRALLSATEKDQKTPHVSTNPRELATRILILRRQLELLLSSN